MARNRDDRLVIWPLYFDSRLTKAQGRRLPTGLVVERPGADDIFSVCRKLGLSPELQDEKTHPSAYEANKGRVLVRSQKNKTSTLRDIAKGLLRQKK